MARLLSSQLPGGFLYETAPLGIPNNLLILEGACSLQLRAGACTCTFMQKYWDAATV